MELEQIRVEELLWEPDKHAGPVLDRINAILHSGDFYGILGPNGAGKSSFVRALLCLNKRDGGDIGFARDGKLRGIDSIGREEMAGMLSFLPQGMGADVDFVAYDVVAMGREPYRKRFMPLTNEDKEKIEEAMTFTNCLHLKDRNIRHLSGGERQRVMLARTVAQDTPWIILDEPVTGLDIKHQYEVMKELSRLRCEKKKTVIAILHDLNLAYAFCNQIVLMKEGKVYALGETRRVLTPENLKEVYGMEFDFVRAPQGEREYIAARY